MKKRYIFFKLFFFLMMGFCVGLSNVGFASSDTEDASWDQLSVSVRIQAYVNAIAYEQTDTLCYSYGKLLSDLNENNTNVSFGNINHAHGKSVSNLRRTSSFNRHFFSDAQFRKSIREWLFFHSDALNQAIKNSDLTPAEQAAINRRDHQQSEGLWNRIKNFFSGSTESNTHSFSARYTQYVTYLVQSAGFDTAIRHCALRNGLEKEELKEAMTNTLLSHNRSVGLGTGVVVLAALAYTGWHTFSYALKGLAVLGRGMQYIWRLRSYLPHKQGRLVPQINQAQQQVVQRQMQKLTEQNNKFKSFVSMPSWTTAGLVSEVAVESGFVLYFAHEMTDNMSKNQEQLPEKNVSAQRQRAMEIMMQQQMVDPYSSNWWRSRLQDYEKLIDRGLRLNQLEETTPNQPQTLEAKRIFQILLDFYLIDYWVIQNEIDSYREKVVDLEKQIYDICPTRIENPNVDKSLLTNDLMASSYYQSNRNNASYLCRRRNQEQIQEIQQAVFDARYSNSYRILRTVLPLFQFRKEQLETALNNTEASISHKVLFELIDANRNNNYGLCPESLSRNGYDFYQSPLCEFHFLHVKSLLSPNRLSEIEVNRLEELSQTIGL